MCWGCSLHPPPPSHSLAGTGRSPHVSSSCSCWSSAQERLTPMSRQSGHLASSGSALICSVSCSTLGLGLQIGLEASLEVRLAVCKMQARHHPTRQPLFWAALLRRFKSLADFTPALGAAPCHPVLQLLQQDPCQRIPLLVSCCSRSPAAERAVRSAGKLRAFQGFLEFLLDFFPPSFQNYFFPTAQFIFISSESLTLPAGSPHSFPQLSTASSETRTLMRCKYYRDISEENLGF